MRRTRGIFIAAVLAGALQLAAQQSPAPQRTIVSRQESAVSENPKPDGGASSSASLEQYRRMWEKMTAVQQKAFLGSGGYTPEQYERLVKQRGGAVANSRDDAGSDAFDALSRSLRDLNAIRDGNLSRVQKDGCPPEIASRIADLKGKLQNDDFELNGREAPGTGSAVPKAPEKSSTGDPLALAADWFKRPPDREPGAPAPASGGSSRESRLLDEALNGSERAATLQQDPKSPEAERARKSIQDDMARIQAELAQLSGACASSKP